ncbi:PAS domain-containing protein [Aureimonas leprariae]|uniref:Blue-light-activated histidine kinase n=2 Tax=Plantimonas leprariae TaxID=2615207 RepID=A0A7V7PTD6_9HYPH|nr:PAS domain-containing protein [Aureimonas leprariae]
MVNDATLPAGIGRPFTAVCAIGASAGGVEALRTFFRQVPPDLGLAYVVIVHLAPDQPSALGQILGNCTRMPVNQVDDSPTLKPNCVYVIPPNRQLVIDGDNVTLRPFDEPRGQRAPIDSFFRSVAAGRGDGLAMILSGAGADGSLGIRAIKEAGGVVFVQEPAEAQFPSMPQSAIATGAADFVAPIARLVERMGEVAKSKEAVRSLDMDGAANDLRRIVSFLRARTGHDFSSYKRATVMRRVQRRMQVRRVTNLADYADALRETPEEAQELFADLLISVTMFFRDNKAFGELQRQVIGPLFEDVPDEGLRAWVVGCATGEEAYSLAMVILEEAAQRKVHVPIQIFASDLDEGALATAREGRYPRSIEADVSDERLKRFFVDEGTHYRVRKEVRDTVLFASHSVLKDPPFTRLDLVSCRNLLIYLERSLQTQVCSIFHYGLKPNHFLFLGSAETIDSNPDQFVAVDREARIYRSRPQAGSALPIVPQAPVMPLAITAARQSNWRLAERVGQPAETHAAALEQASPPSILVDESQTIVHLSPTAGRFILHSAGPFSPRLSGVVRPELRLDLKLALDRAFEGRLPTLTHPVAVDFDGARRRIAMQVAPILVDAHAPTQALVFFVDGGPAEEDDALEIEGETRPDETRRLYAELKGTQEALLSARTEHEASVQDLRAANEELQSINEEYRSTSEELETSKEELQSINEELQTVNAELKAKLEDISAAHSDLENLTAATEIGTLFLDTDLRIRMFTPPVADLFNITQADVGRAITDFTHRLVYEGVEDNVRQVLRDLAPIETEVRSKDGRWYMLRLRPYRTVENNINGTVMTFVDVSARREAEEAVREREAQLKVMVAELHHRTRNLIGIVGTIMRQLVGSSGSLADFRARFTERLEALSRVQSMLSRRGDEGTDVGEIVRLELDALGADLASDRLSIHGEPVVLARSTAQTLALAIHELTTNAKKYGALQADEGVLAVRWDIDVGEDGQRRLRFTWTETGIDAQVEETEGPMRKGGYGRELIERALPYTLKATTTYTLGRDRLDCTIDLPL